MAPASAPLFINLAESFDHLSRAPISEAVFQIRGRALTAWDEPVFPNLISYIERGEIIPLLAKQFDLKDIVEAQKEFTQKTHIGKFALIPPALTATQKSALAE